MGQARAGSQKLSFVHGLVIPLEANKASLGDQFLVIALGANTLVV